MNTELIEKVKKIACDKHNHPAPEQRYGEKPYSVHLEDVVEYILKYIYYIIEPMRENVICAGWGHDLIEDTELDCNDLEKMFNKVIAELIYRISNERGRNRKEKNFKTYPKIWVDEFAIYVKLADRLANTKNSKDTGYRMYKVYQKEYPVFKYALQVNNLYPDMWKELDELNILE